MVSTDLRKWLFLEKEKNSKESLGFAVSLIGFCIFILFTIIPQAFQEPIDTATAAGWQMLKVFIYVIIAILILYIFLAGYTFNSRISNESKMKLLGISSYLYESSFYIMILAIFVPAVTYFHLEYLEQNVVYYTILIAIGVLLAKLLTKYLIVIRDDKYTTLVTLVFLLSAILIAQNLDFDLTTVDVNMQSTYGLSESPLAINVKVTGQNENLTVLLYEQEDMNSPILTQTENLNFDINTPRIIKENGSLRGIYLGEGFYSLYINTSDMNPGIYGLTFHVHRHNEYSTFYILNNDEDEKESYNNITSAQNETI